MSSRKSASDEIYGDLTGREFEDEVRRFENHMSVSKHGSARVIATLYAWMGVARLRQMNNFFDDFGI